MAEPNPISQPSEKLEAVVGALSEAEIPYAVGGAIAASVWSEPRDTQDIDIDVFIPESQATRIFDVLESLGMTIDRTEAQTAIEIEGQRRFDWDGTYVDFFFAYDPFHASCAERAVLVEYGGLETFVLSAEDIVAFKTMFNRPQDWIDIEKIIATQGERFDSDYALDWLTRILGEGDAALERLRGLIEEYRLNPA